MSLMRETSRAIRVTLVLWVLTGIIYPLVMVLVGQVIFPDQANGSLIESNGKVVGSALIGQPFTSAQYFNSRPSAYSYSTADPKNDEDGILKTGVSGASNLAPSNPELLKRGDAQEGFEGVQVEVDKLKQAGIQPSADLVYTSGSSLDPHISIEAANAQVERVARARSLPPDQVRPLINQNTDGRFLGIFGEPGVNVLKLNLALDALQPGR